MRYLVTGAAGFIGSHLAEALAARGDDVVGLDSFNDYYDPARKRENAAGLDVARRRTCSRPTSTGCSPTSTPSSTSRASPASGRASGPGSSTTSPERPRERAPLRGGRAARQRGSCTRPPPRCTATPRRYPTSEDVDAAPDLAVRRDEAVRRAPRLRPRAHDRARRGRASATSPSTARASGRTWRSRRCSRPSPPGRRSGSSATGRCRAASPTSPTPSPGTIAAMEHGRGGRDLQRRRRRGGDDERGDRARRARRRAASSRSSGTAPAVGDVRRTRADVAKARAELGWAPTTGLADGLRAQWEWVAARVAAP